MYSLLNVLHSKHTGNINKCIFELRINTYNDCPFSKMLAYQVVLGLFGCFVSAWIISANSKVCVKMQGHNFYFLSCKILKTNCMPECWQPNILPSWLLLVSWQVCTCATAPSCKTFNFVLFWQRQKKKARFCTISKAHKFMFLPQTPVVFNISFCSIISIPCWAGLYRKCVVTVLQYQRVQYVLHRNIACTNWTLTV